MNPCWPSSAITSSWQSTQTIAMPTYYQRHFQQYGRIDEAIETCRKGLAVCPLWKPCSATTCSCCRIAPTLTPRHCLPSISALAILRTLLSSTLPHSNTRDPLRTLKVGFVSGDLLNHPVPHFLIPILENIADGARLSLYAYHNNPQNDDITERLREVILHWRQVEHLSDPDLGQLIHDDGIDILIDLSGHTGENRLSCLPPSPPQSRPAGSATRSRRDCRRSITAERSSTSHHRTNWAASSPRN